LDRARKQGKTPDDLVGDAGVDVLLFGSLHCVSPLRAF
jgi:hypothetical protein